MRKLSVSLLFFLFFVSTMHAQSVVEPQNEYDTSKKIINNEEEESPMYPGFAKEVMSDTSISFSAFEIKKDSLKAFKLKKEYKWVSSIDSFLKSQQKEAQQQTKRVIKRDSGNSFLSRLLNSSALQIIMWLAAASLVVFIIYKLFLSEGLFARRSTTSKINITESEEEVNLNNDFESLLHNACNQADWRAATRFLFLNALKKLNQNNMINYGLDKTNRAYINEIPSPLKNDFAILIRYYEFIWYGNIEIDPEQYKMVETKFNNFLSRI